MTGKHYPTMGGKNNPAIDNLMVNVGKYRSRCKGKAFEQDLPNISIRLAPNIRITAYQPNQMLCPLYQWRLVIRRYKSSLVSISTHSAFLMDNEEMISRNAKKKQTEMGLIIKKDL